MARFKGVKPETGKFLREPPKPSVPDSLQYPTFCLRHIIRHQNFSFEGLSEEQKAAFVDTLRNLSQLTWAQIRGSHRHGLGTEKIEQHVLKCPLPPHVTEDVTILAIRFHGKAPMLGYRNGTTLHIICLDANFSAYDHGS